ncbi:MAG TPA: copper amine oxidase N-terminal domain-containing protein [Clostridia bacterium]
MKKYLVILTVIFVMLTGATFSNAVPGITENQNVKVIIDGKTTTYDQSPITVNGRTLLPLRAILTNLGVPNDDAHIIWSGSDKSVTVVNNSIKIFLKVDSTTASVNGQNVEIDAAPVNYQDHVYIPARFVSQSLGKKVFWDKLTSSVLIRNEKDFNDTKDILAKCNEALKNITKMKFTLSGNSVSSRSNKDKMDFTIQGEVNKDKRMFHYLINDHSDEHYNIESYCTDKNVYTKLGSTNVWNPGPISSEQFEEALSTNGGTIDMNYSDELIAGLAVDTSDPDQVVLKGDIYRDPFFKVFNQDVNGLGIEFVKLYTELHIDKKSNLPSKVVANVAFKSQSNIGSNGALITNGVEITYTDFNGNVDIALPDGLK